MQKILWLGKKYFADELVKFGWEQVKILENPRLESGDWQELMELAGFRPDLVVIVDELPILFNQILTLPVLTIYYSTCSNRFPLHARYAQMFDACLLAQEGHRGNFSGPFLGGERIWWLPLYADMQWTSRKSRKGSIDIYLLTDQYKANPREYDFWQKLEENASVKKYQGLHTPKGYDDTRIAVHYSEYGDVDSKVFELMASGVCLLTPRLGHGLEKLFVDGEHYIGYANDDAGDAAYRLEFLQNHPDLPSYVGQTGADEINAHHRAIHRAESFTYHICDLVLGNQSAIINQRLNNTRAMASYLSENGIMDNSKQ